MVGGTMNDKVENSTTGVPKGLVHIYFGDGKGKTTATAGLALRAAGNDHKVLVAQFFKGRASGEIAVLSSLPNVTVLRGDTSKKFVWEMDDAEAVVYLASQEALLQEAWGLASQGDFDLLVLDEILYLPFHQTVSEEQLLEMLSTKPEKLEVVMTGRKASEALQLAADYVTEMVSVKHPYDSGTKQRRGIEF